MRTFVSLMIQPDTPINAELARDIARIELGGGSETQTLQMHGGTPVEQAAWLRRLAVSAKHLATELEALAAEAVS